MSIKTCIWCQKKDDDVPFLKKAHTIPQSLGGTHVCENVCDNCNAFFGNHFQGYPSIEAIVKETFNISRTIFLDTIGEIGKNKKQSRFSSIYFTVDFNKKWMDLKPGFKLRSGFQEKIGRQLKKGIYKIYLEELDRQTGNGLDSKYDFIREFARYNLGDYPVFYFERIFGVIFFANQFILKPEIYFGSQKPFKYLLEHQSFFEFELLGHVFGIVTSRHWNLSIENYLRETKKIKTDTFKRWLTVQKFTDVDFMLSVLDDKKYK